MNTTNPTATRRNNYLSEYGKVTFTVTIDYKYCGTDDTDYAEAIIQDHLKDILTNELEDSTLDLVSLEDTDDSVSVNPWLISVRKDG